LGKTAFQEGEEQKEEITHNKAQQPKLDEVTNHDFY